MNTQYYDGTKLLSLLDLNKNVPEIFICIGNRSAGKTTYYNRYLVNRFKKYGEKFMLLYRYKLELTDISSKFFNEINRLFFPSDEMTEKSRQSGTYVELYLNHKLCGYAVAINCSEKYKKFSHLFADVSRILFDEFQSENNDYCPNEVNKFHSIHTTVARGGGKQVRYVPVIMLSNAVTVLNPYFVALNVASRINADTKYIRGNGFVLEQTINENAKAGQLESAFNKAFSDNDILKSITDNQYVYDTDNFIEQPEGVSKYLATFLLHGKSFSIREYPSGIIYVSASADTTFPLKIALTNDDHTEGTVLADKQNFMIANLRYLYKTGQVRFQNQQAKEMFFKLL